MKLYQLVIVICATVILLVIVRPKYEEKPEVEKCAILMPENTPGSKTKDGRFKSNGNIRDVEEGSWLEECD